MAWNGCWQPCTKRLDPGSAVGVVFSDVAVDGEIPILNLEEASSRCSKRINLRKTYMENWKIPCSIREYIFKRSIFHCHVSLPEGI